MELLMVLQALFSQGSRTWLSGFQVAESSLVLSDWLPTQVLLQTSNCTGWNLMLQSMTPGELLPSLRNRGALKNTVKILQRNCIAAEAVLRPEQLPCQSYPPGKKKNIWEGNARPIIET